MNEYERKQEEKKERYQARAEKADKEASDRWDASRQAVAGIPPGQPILVGHHSEKRHRAALKRADGHSDKAMEAHNKAKHYRSKAAGIGKGGISSDDPDAVDKLKEKLAGREKLQAGMKAINKAYTQAKRPVEGDPEEKWVKFQELVGEELSDDAFQKLRARIGDGTAWNSGKPFPSYALTNNNANIRRIRERIEHLERQAGDETTTKEINGIQIVDNVEENRVQLFFPCIPEKPTRQQMKQYGFRFSKANGNAWQRHRGNQAMHWAEYIAKEWKQPQES